MYNIPRYSVEETDNLLECILEFILSKKIHINYRLI